MGCFGGEGLAFCFCQSEGQGHAKQTYLSAASLPPSCARPRIALVNEVGNEGVNLVLGPRRRFAEIDRYREFAFLDFSIDGRLGSFDALDSEIIPAEQPHRFVVHSRILVFVTPHGVSQGTNGRAAVVIIGGVSAIRFEGVYQPR